MRLEVVAGAVQVVDGGLQAARHGGAALVGQLPQQRRQELVQVQPPLVHQVRLHEVVRLLHVERLEHLLQSELARLFDHIIRQSNRSRFILNFARWRCPVWMNRVIVTLI